MSLPKAFLAASLLGAAGVVAMAFMPVAPKPHVSRHTSQPAALRHDIHVRDQISIADVSGLDRSGYRMLIDLRPDGEARDQPASDAVALAAAKAGVRFAYVPTPNGDIPDSVVQQLSKALEGAEGPVLLYCRSGSRAARVWALAEASRPGGADATAIADSVRRAGQKVDDLMPRIAARIAARH